MHGKFILCLLLVAAFSNTGCDLTSTSTGAIKEKNRLESASHPASKTKSFPKPTGDRAKQLLNTGQVEEAWKLAQQVLVVSPDDSQALHVAASILYMRGKLPEAIELLDRVPQKIPIAHLMSCGQAADWLLGAGQIREAEKRFRKILERHPNDVMVNRKLLEVLGLQGRRWETRKNIIELISLGKQTDFELMMLINWYQPLDVNKEVNSMLEKNASDPLPKLGLAYTAYYKGNPEESLDLFREVFNYPEPPTAAWLGVGLSLTKLQDWNSIPRWLDDEPSDAREFPDCWLVLAQWYDSQMLPEKACRCLAEALALDPDYLYALRLGMRCLTELGETEFAGVLDQREKHVDKTLDILLSVSAQGKRSPELVNAMCDELEQLGRIAEARAWRSLNTVQPGTRSANDLVGAQSMLQLKSLIESIRSRFPISETRGTKAPSKYPEAVASNRQSPIRLEDVPSKINIAFSYINGWVRKNEGMTIFQSGGGGVGVLDFDRDGWPDLVAVQGGEHPEHGCLPSCLFRNFLGKQFVEVGAVAGVQNLAYGQGIAAGDFDQDGFMDLFFGNIGRNNLYLNNGDGTFSIQTYTEDPDRKWTASCAIADITGDGLPDLIEANYVDYAEAISKRCVGKSGTEHACTPTEYKSDLDRIFINRGDGNFDLISTKWKLAERDGRGLGLLISNIDGKNGNDVYIANDMSNNNFLVSYPDPENPGKFFLKEEAILRGCAVDENGRPQGSMGIALDDVDRNRLPDLFVTNALSEYNILYSQTRPGLFEDRTRYYKLMHLSDNLLAFGIQACDFDCDGIREWVILNGHIDDYSKEGIPFQMPAQILCRDADKFVWQEAEAGGAYFQKQTVGRALASWDFDRNGRMDLVATHLDHPLSVLENQCETGGHWLEFELVGTKSDRDAVGSVAEIRVQDAPQVAFVTAGDGYESSNERLIHFGLGNHPRVESVTIKWPNGSTESFDVRDPDRRYLIIEGIGCTQR